MKATLTFDTWEDAFARCREMDKPVIVAVLLVAVPGHFAGREVAKIFPSGRAKHLRYERTEERSAA